MKKLKFTSLVLKMTVVSCGLLVFAIGTSQAATVAYWRFENTTASEVNFPALNYTAGDAAGFSTSVPDVLVADSVAATSVANTASYNQLAVVGTGTPSTVADNVLLDNAIEGNSFTIEAFVNLDIGGTFAFDSIIGNLGGPGGFVFRLLADGDGDGVLNFRAVQDADGSSKTISSAKLTEGSWQHVAVVGTDIGSGNVSAQLYLNYAPTGLAATLFGGVRGNALDYDIGAPNPFNGLFDELRISDTALATGEFLTAIAIPEPTSVVLLGMGAFLVMFRRRGAC